MSKSKERESVLAKAKALGLKFAKNLSTKRIQGLIDSHKFEPVSEVPEATENPDIPKSTTPDPPKDRVHQRRNPPCPACGAHPVVCRMRRGDYAAFRCRECDHRWEISA